jgi:hypothetical protein
MGIAVVLVEKMNLGISALDLLNPIIPNFAHLASYIVSFVLCFSLVRLKPGFVSFAISTVIGLIHVAYIGYLNLPKIREIRGLVWKSKEN